MNEKGGRKRFYFFLGVVVGVAIYSIFSIFILIWHIEIIPNKCLIEIQKQIGLLDLTNDSMNSYEEAIIGRWNSLDAVGAFFEFYDDGKCVIEMMPMSFMISGIPGTYEIKEKILQIRFIDPRFLSNSEDEPLKLSLEILRIGARQMVLINTDGEEGHWRRVRTP